jgi:hypothetical protein
MTSKANLTIEEEWMGENRPAVNYQGMGPGPRSCIVHRQGRIKIDFDATDQRLEPVDQSRIHGLQALGMACYVDSQEAQELAEHWVVYFKAFGACRARQHDFATGADAVADLVAFAEPQGPPTGTSTVVW